MSNRYPGYDVLAKRDTTSWNAQTRQVIDSRLTVSLEPRFFSPNEWRTLGAICDRIMPQPPDRPPVPLPIYVDQKMADNVLDGYRYAVLPPQGEAWQRAIAALEAEAGSSYDAAFHALSGERQDELLRRMQRGELTGSAWGNMPCKIFFEHRLIPDITHAYYAHPVSWNEIGFGGPASPRGYVRMRLDRRDPWEAIEAKPGEEERAQRKNEHVR
jgi:hypothetical protein